MQKHLRLLREKLVQNELRHSLKFFLGTVDTASSELKRRRTLSPALSISARQARGFAVQESSCWTGRLQSTPSASWKHSDCGLSSSWSPPFSLRLRWEKRRRYTRSLLPTFFTRGPGFKFKNCGFLKMFYFLTFNIWYAVYVLLWIKFWFLRFANHCILFLFTFCTTSWLFQNWGCKYGALMNYPHSPND